MEREAKQHKSWPYWEGSVADVLRVASAMEEAFERERRAAEAAAEQLEADKSEEWRSGPQAAARVREHFSIRARVRESDLAMDTEGEVQSVIEEVRIEDVESVALRFPQSSVPPILGGVRGVPDGRSCEVRLTRQSGVTLDVTGDDRQWVRGTLAHVGAEIERGVPWFAWLRSEWAVLPLGAAVLALGIYLTALLVPSRADNDDLAYVFAFSLVGWVAGVLYLFRRFVMPGIYLAPTKGEKSPVRRFGLGLLAIVVLPIVLGVLGIT